MREIVILAELPAAFGLKSRETLLKEIHDDRDKPEEDTDDFLRKDLQSSFCPYPAAAEVLESHALLTYRMKGLLMEPART